MRRRAARLSARFGLALVASYAIAWGLTWLAGSTDSADVVRGDGYARVSYPGVAFGGLPPAPSVGDAALEAGAITFGVLTLVLLGPRELRVRVRRR